MALFSSTKKTRYAVVGIGWFAQAAVLPGFQNADNAELVALVSGDPTKHEELTAYYKVPAYTYDQYDELMASGKVDAVFIVLPNAMHKDYTVRAAKHKVHVLCEKPMAADAAEAREMIAACERNGVKLMTAYRLHLEHANLAAIELVKGGKLGDPRLFQSTNCQRVEANSTRLEGELAGGPLMDLGVYCINAARYLFQADPVEVVGHQATVEKSTYDEVPEMTTGLLKFPGGRLATFACGFGAGKVSEYRIIGTEGSLTLDPAYSFTGDKEMTVELDAKSEPDVEMYKDTDHVGAELAYFAECIQKDKTPEPDGYEGLADMLIIDALKESAKTGKAVKVGPFKDKPRPDKSMRYKLPQIKQPEMVNAKSPSGE